MLELYGILSSLGVETLGRSGKERNDLCTECHALVPLGLRIRGPCCLESAPLPFVKILVIRQKQVPETFTFRAPTGLPKQSCFCSEPQGTWPTCPLVLGSSHRAAKICSCAWCPLARL